MRKKNKLTEQEIINKAYNHYMCLQSEDFFLSFDKKGNFFEIYWHTFMDSYINMNKVMNVAKFIRKHSDLPIIDCCGVINI